ncbi:MAG: hypothetical protein Q4Q53_07465, partial [Methanocorpusculum sp.]|nr:hypothetical protein [Methanocorpusculum sp.]
MKLDSNIFKGCCSLFLFSTLFLLFAVTGSIFAAGTAGNAKKTPEWQNPEITGVNNLASHSTDVVPGHADY